MAKILASVVGVLMNAQVCTRPDVACTISVPCIYLSDPSKDQWKAVVKVMKYLQGTENHMLTFERSDPS